MNGIINNMFRLIKKHSPEILLTLGVGGVVTGTIMACKETKELDPILKEHEEKMNDIHESADKGFVSDENNMQVEYTEKDVRRDTTKVYACTAYKLGKLYFPSACIIGASIGCFIGSNGILTRRNVGLTAAYAGLSETFNNYRRNIVDKFGEVADAEARYNIKAKKVKGKNGEEDHYQYTQTRALPETDHSRFFDAESKFWDKNINMDLVFLQSTQTNLNRKLLLRGSNIIPLNEVYDAIGIKRPAKDGQIMGYRYRDGDELDENGIPTKIKILIYVLEKNGKRSLKTVNEAIEEYCVDEPVMLLDFPNLELIID